jgi:hypothetical protein
MLLKMSVDKFLICNIDLVVEYGRTIEALLDSLPDPSWSSFVSKYPLIPYANPRNTIPNLSSVYKLPNFFSLVLQSTPSV